MWVIPRNFPCSVSAPATEAWNSESEPLFRMLAQSLAWRGKPSPWRTWRQRWKRAQWIRALSGRISETAHGSSSVAAWLDSWPVIPASPRAPRGCARAKRTSVGSGPTSAMQLKLCDLPGVSLRTSPGMCPVGLRTSCTTWAAWVTSIRRASGQRLRLALHTSESACSSLLPTPTVHGNTNSANEKSGDGLRTRLVKMLPTPTAAQYGSNAGGKNPGPARHSLESMARKGFLTTPMLPTPKARDHRSEAGSQERGHARDLPEVCGGLLNPRFVEAMMLLPPGLTSYACSETGWCQPKQQRHSDALLGR